MNTCQFARAEWAHEAACDLRHQQRMSEDERRAEAIEAEASLIWDIEIATNDDPRRIADWSISEALGELERDGKLPTLGELVFHRRAEEIGAMVLEQIETYCDRWCRSLAEARLTAQALLSSDEAAADRYRERETQQ